MNKTPKDVDSYIAAAPKEVRVKLQELRAAIKKTAPTAAERISYGMPYYHYKGRLAYFGLAKAHIGLYIPSPSSPSTDVNQQPTRPRTRLSACLWTRSFPSRSSESWCGRA